MGYSVENVPKTGNRQYGVDIHAENKSELLLCVVKQGDINRKVWDDGQNSVRQSINEIFDAYLNILNNRKLNKKIQIVVITNGVLDETIKVDWEGYCKNHSYYQEKRVEIVFWGIDNIVGFVEKYLFDEHLFPSELRSLLRKALYFIEETDYKNVYFENIINYYIEKLSLIHKDTSIGRQTKKKITKKHIYGMFLATQMIAQYASNIQRYKVSIIVSEYLLIQFWKFLFENELFEKELYIEPLIRFCKSYEKWNYQYYQNIKCFCEKKYAFPQYNIIEQRVLLYEVVGYLTSYGFYLIAADEKLSHEVLNTIITLINNNPQIYYAPYDCHIGVIIMLYRLLVKLKRNDDIEALLGTQTNCLMYHYIGNGKYPSSEDSFEDAVAIEMKNNCSKFETSALWGNFLLWIGAMRLESEYNSLKSFLDEDLESVTKCAWFLRDSEEKIFYEYNAMYKAGDGMEITTEKDYKEFIERIDFILQQYKDECFSYNKYSFDALEMIVCRYYGYIPKTLPLLN